MTDPVGVTDDDDDLADDDLSTDDDIAELDLEELLEEPVVESASKRVQALGEASVSISVIDHEEMRLASADWFPEVLRRMPGVFVMQTAANHYSVGMRGQSLLLNNRVLTLVNGRSVAETSNGYTPWSALGASIGDFERAEVIRGPNSTLYGANAFSGVINLTTKRPLDHPGAEGSAHVGVFMTRDQEGDDSNRPRMSVGGRAHAAYNITNDAGTLGGRLSFGTGFVPEWTDLADDGFYQHGPYSYVGAAGFDFRPTQNVSLYVRASHAGSEATVPFTPLTNARPVRANDSATTATLDVAELGIKELALHLHADGRRLTVLSAAADNDGVGEVETVNYRVHGQGLLHLTLLDGKSVTSAGFEASFSAIEDFFDKNPTARYVAGLAQQEFALLDRSVILSVGSRVDVTMLSDGFEETARYNTINPRVGLIWRVTPEHALRIASGTAFRIPSPFENFVDIGGLDAGAVGPPHRVVAGNARLQPEKVRSLELGYRARPIEELGFEITPFYQRANDLIRFRPLVTIPVIYDNVADVDTGGAEVSFKAAPTQTTALYGSYTFTKSVDTESDEEVFDFPEHMGSVGIEQRLPFKLRISADGYFTSPIMPIIFQTTPSGSFVVERAESRPQAIVNLRVGKVMFDERAEVFVAGRNLAGFGRKPNNLRHFPSPIAQPIGGSVIVGASIREL